MRLSWALLKQRNIIPGHRYLGKKQMPIVIWPWALDSFKKKLSVEEQNLFYLRHPYLTLEQEKGHAKALGKKEAWMSEKQLLKASIKLNKSVRMENYIGHLNVSNKWER